MVTIEHKTKTKKKIKVRIIRAPIVNSEELRSLIFSRSKALVLS